jgi:hypothetical protein
VATAAVAETVVRVPALGMEAMAETVVLADMGF